MANIKWLQLTDSNQLEEIKALSADVPCIIFKHSTRCSISSLAQNRLESKWSFEDNTVLPYFLDLIAYRELSNGIAETFGVRHESPQLLLIQDGQCTYEASHLDISVRELSAALGQQV
jgi:bacillithiol system protein YtxJ